MSVPRDPIAEITVVGAAIYSPRGAELAHSRLTVADFHDVALARLFDVALVLPDPPVADHQLEPWRPLRWELRADAAAELADVRLADVREVVNRRAVLEDVTGHYARRVRAAADERRQLHRLAEEAHALGFDLVPRNEATR